MYIILSQIVLGKDWFTAFKVKVTAKVENFNEWSFRWYRLNRWTFCNQMLVHLLEPECRAKRLLCYLQGQGHSEGACNKKITVSTVSTELLNLTKVQTKWACIDSNTVTYSVSRHTTECILHRMATKTFIVVIILAIHHHLTWKDSVNLNSALTSLTCTQHSCFSVSLFSHT